MDDELHKLHEQHHEAHLTSESAKDTARIVRSEAVGARLDSQRKRAERAEARHARDVAAAMLRKRIPAR